MSAPAFSDFDGLPDALNTGRFELLIEPTVAPGINRVLALRCQQIAVPSITIEQMIVGIHGHEYVFRGRRTYEKTIVGVFVETSDGEMMRRLHGWIEQVVGSESGDGASKKEYSTIGTLNIFDQSGNVAHSVTFQNLWPQIRGEVQLNGQDGETSPFLVNLTFSFDRMLHDGVEIN